MSSKACIQWVVAICGTVYMVDIVVLSLLKGLGLGLFVLGSQV